MSSFPHGARAAVSLTYDDALDGHWRDVAPRLEAAGLRGTFNLFPHATCTQRVSEWRRVAAAGHELGNHSLFHPCRKEPPGAANWLPDDFDLCRYSPKRWREEMRIASFLLHLIDGRTQRTFSNTCCNTTIGTGDQTADLAPIIEEMFVAGRGPLTDQAVDPATANFGGLGHYNGDGHTFESLRDIVEAAAEAGAWAIFMFHGVGNAEHRLHIDPAEHARFIEYLGREQGRIHTAPFVDVAAHLRYGGRGSHA